MYMPKSNTKHAMALHGHISCVFLKFPTLIVLAVEFYYLKSGEGTNLSPAFLHISSVVIDLLKWKYKNRQMSQFPLFTQVFFLSLHRSSLWTGLCGRWGRWRRTTWWNRWGKISIIKQYISPRWNYLRAGHHVMPLEWLLTISMTMPMTVVMTLTMTMTMTITMTMTM